MTDEFPQEHLAMLFHSRVPPTVREALLRVAGQEKPVLVALSGGADSVFLAALVVSLEILPREMIVLVHVHHGLRGADADADADFCEAYAKWLGCRFQLQKVVPAQSDEATLRDLRYTALETVGREVGAAAICLGHQLDDVGEQMLMRLGSGAGLSGLAAPRPVQLMERGLGAAEASRSTGVCSGLRAAEGSRSAGVCPGLIRLRPLLNIAGEELRASLKKWEMPWREDVSNQSSAYTRNRVRQDVIPAWMAALPQNVLQGAARSRFLLEESEQALEAWFAEVEPGLFARSDCALGAALYGKPRALWRMALVRFLAKSGSTVPGPVMQEVLLDAWMFGSDGEWSLGQSSVCLRGGELSIGGGGPAKVAFTPLIWGKGVRLAWLGDGWLSRDVVAADFAMEQFKSPEGIARLRVFCDFDEVLKACCEAHGLLEVGSRIEGETFQPLGAPGQRKIQDWMVDRKIPRLKRERLPVIRVKGGEVLWIPGFPPAERYKITNASKLALQLTYCADCGNFPYFNHV